MWLLGCSMMLPPIAACAGGTGLRIALSPEFVAVIQQWRVTHGLAVRDEHTPSAGSAIPAERRRAMAKALALTGADRAVGDARAIEASHEQHHWRVTIHGAGPREEDTVVEVADALVAAEPLSSAPGSVGP
jgi:hypothetical protein